MLFANLDNLVWSDIAHLGTVNMTTDQLTSALHLHWPACLDRLAPPLALKPQCNFKISIAQHYLNPEFGTKFQKKVLLFLEIPEFSYNTVYRSKYTLTWLYGT